ncbi:MAG: MBL fold metallo-hydrolase [Calditrichaeota bacterium]|nr:MBL fold metallo-hydrolase [Calditrichota bacterium]
MIQIKTFEQITIARMARSILGRPLYFTASYLVDGLLIDTGPAILEKELLGTLPLSGVRLIVNTHHHEDHIGNNAALQKKFRLPIYAFSLAIPVIENPVLLHEQLYRRLTWGKVPKPSHPQPIGATITARHLSFRVIYTPGHSFADITLFNPENGWAFTGDIFIRGKETVIRHDSDIKNIMDSLKVLKALNPRVIFPGSGNPILNPQEELDKKLRYFEHLKNRVLSLYAEGKSVKEIRTLLFPKTPLLTRISFGDYSSDSLIRSFIKNFASPR